MATLVDDSGTTRFEGTIEGAGVPVADPSVAGFDGTTYTNPWTGVGKIETLVLASDSSVVALAITGDAFPRLLLTANTLYFGDGTADPTAGPGLFYDAGLLGATTGLKPVAAATPAAAATLGQLSPRFSITSGALPSQSITSGVAFQPSANSDVEVTTSVVFVDDSSCTVAISPDNNTYTTLAVEGLDITLGALESVSVTRLISVRVPAGWYIKWTAAGGATLAATATVY